LRALPAQILRAQETEDHRVARELHDSVNQLLSSVKFRMQSIEERIEVAVDGTMRRDVEKTRLLLEKAIQEVRRIQKTLRPSLLDDLGILPTITWFCREFQSVYADIRIEQHVTIREDDVPEPLKIVIFRIMQEALNNIAKHSGTEKVSLRLEKTPGTIDLIIEDNGRGFSLEEVAAMKGPERGLGLVSMRERAELSGGRCVIDSVEGRGTTVRATWPGVTTS